VLGNSEGPAGRRILVTMRRRFQSIGGVRASTFHVSGHLQLLKASQGRASCDFGRKIQDLTFGLKGCAREPIEMARTRSNPSQPNDASQEPQRGENPTKLTGKLGM
jgi:hypothetical protein